MNQEKQQHLSALALRVREHIVRLSTDGGCFTGASLSCTDLLVYLYADFLNITPATVDATRPRLPFPQQRPRRAGPLRHLSPSWASCPKSASTTTCWLPTASTGTPTARCRAWNFTAARSGHLPSVGLGVALDNRLRGLNNRTIVITGDGELNEGSVWETVLVAAAQKLHNFTLVIDRNHFQANIATEDLIPLEPLAPKFEAFGWEVQRINGHDFQQLEAAFTALPFSPTKPSVIICDTVRGRGLPSIEARADRWFCNFNAEEIESLLKELHSQEATTLTSETLTVR